MIKSLVKKLSTLSKEEIKEMIKAIENNKKQSKKIQSILDQLTESEKNTLFNPIAKTVALPVSSQTFKAMEIEQDPPLGTNLAFPLAQFFIGIYAEVEYKSYYVYTKYTYSATVMDGTGKKRVKVNEIKFHIYRGHESYVKTKKNTDNFEFVDEVYASLNTGETGKLTATATRFKKLPNGKRVKEAVTTEVYY